jgi:hypothetical protein
MKRFFVVLILGFMTIALSYAQDTKPKTNRGDVSMNFVINGFGSFGVTGPLVGTVPFGGTQVDTLFNQLGQIFGLSLLRPIFGVGGTFFLSDNVGLRIAVGFNTTSNSTPRAGDTTGAEDKDSKVAFGISPALQIHLANAGPVTVYTGVALNFATASNSRGEDSLETGSSQSGFGGGGILGAEFFPWDNISLGVESQFGVMIRSTSTTSRGKSTDGPSALDIGFILPFSVNLGVHF